MSQQARDPDPATRGRRRYGRLRLRLRAKLITIHGTTNGMLVDLSVTGARVRLANAVPGNGDAMLQWVGHGGEGHGGKGHEAFGMIVWVHDGECGVLFDEPLPEAILLRMRDAGACPDDREQVRSAAATFVNGRQGFSPEPRARVPFGRR